MNEFPLKEYLYQLWKRRTVVVGFLVSVLALVFVWTLRQPKIFQATTSIEIGTETPDATFFKDIVSVSSYGWWSAMRYYETQYQMIKSRDLLSKVAHKAKTKGLFSDTSIESITPYLQGSVVVESDENSRIAKIHFRDSRPDYAQKLSILIAEVYVEENLAKKLRGVSEAVDWLNARLTEVRKEKTEKERELQQKRESLNILSIENQRDVYTEKIRSMTQRLNVIRTNRIEIQAKYEKLKQIVNRSAETEQLLGVLSNELLKRFKQQLADLKAQRAKLSLRYLEKHPEMLEIQNQIDEVNNLIQQEVNNEVNRLKTSFLLAQAEEDSLNQALEEQKLEALKMEEWISELEEVTLLNNANKEVYETLLKKIKEADLSALVRSNNVRIVDRALYPYAPISPNVYKNILIAIMVGLLGGVFLALTVEYLDDTFQSVEELERYLRIPLLGIVPRVNNFDPKVNEGKITPQAGPPPSGFSAKNSARVKIWGRQLVSRVGHFFQTSGLRSFVNKGFKGMKLGEPLSHPTKAGPASSKYDISFLPYRMPQSVAVEAYRMIRTNLLFLNRDKQGSRILFVSTGPGEGKSVTVTNVGATLAQLGKRTLLVDLDLRKPRLHSLIDVPVNRGLTNVLLNEIDLKDAVHPTRIDNLDVLTSGSIPPNPSELIGSSELAGILDDVSKQYDFVLIDSSPVAPVTDALVSGQLCDKVVMVIRAGKTQRKAVAYAMKQLRSVDMDIAGCILNDVEAKWSNYSLYQYYQYGYGQENSGYPKKSAHG